ncbi:MAG: VWA domain-containing protein [Planctomycetes bacterium]|nr:VWA domain-containing protein [Planctomycetota bacterium]
MVYRFYCENCGQKLKASEDQVGRHAKCPRCRLRFTIPPPPAAPTPQVSETKTPTEGQEQVFSDAQVSQALDEMGELTVVLAEPLKDRLMAQIRRTPWWAISAAAHVLLFLILAKWTFSVSSVDEGGAMVNIQLKKTTSEGKVEYLKKEDVTPELLQVLPTVPVTVRPTTDSIEVATALPRRDAKLIGIVGGGTAPSADFQKKAVTSSRVGAAEISFFGHKTGGTVKTVVFIVDKSGSMIGERLTEATRELKDTIAKMALSVRFNVIFFEERRFDKLADALVPATVKNKIDAYAFIDEIEAVGLSEPLEAFRFAFRLGPETIYMLTDGEFDERVCDAVKKMNQELSPSNRIKIMTIAFKDRRGDYQLKRLARESGGQFKFVP